MVAPKTFTCVECKRHIPIAYRSNHTPYGMEGPVCVMCVSYWEYLMDDDDEGLDPYDID